MSRWSKEAKIDECGRWQQRKWLQAYRPAGLQACDKAPIKARIGNVFLLSVSVDQNVAQSLLFMVEQAQTKAEKRAVRMLLFRLSREARFVSKEKRKIDYDWTERVEYSMTFFES